MNIIYDVIRLDPAVPGLAVSGNDWTVTPRENLMGHYPTQTAYVITLDDNSREKDMVGALDYVAHLVGIANGHALPPPDQIEALGREAIVMYLVATGRIPLEEESKEPSPYASNGQVYDC